MGRNTPLQDGPHSPFDPYISQAMTLIATSEDTSFSNLSDLCARELHWLPGFCDVIVTILRANGLIQVFEWEPGRVHISHHGERWVHAGRDTISRT